MVWFQSLVSRIGPTGYAPATPRAQSNPQHRATDPVRNERRAFTDIHQVPSDWLRTACLSQAQASLKRSIFMAYHWASVLAVIFMAASQLRLCHSPTWLEAPKTAAHEGRLRHTCGHRPRPHQRAVHRLKSRRPAAAAGQESPDRLRRTASVA